MAVSSPGWLCPAQSSLCSFSLPEGLCWGKKEIFFFSPSRYMCMLQPSSKCNMTRGGLLELIPKDARLYAANLACRRVTAPTGCAVPNRLLPIHPSLLGFPHLFKQEGVFSFVAVECCLLRMHRAGLRRSCSISPSSGALPGWEGAGLGATPSSYPWLHAGLSYHLHSFWVSSEASSPGGHRSSANKG